MCARIVLILASSFLAVESVIASINHIPQPWREQAVVQGRNVDYGTDWFMHQFSVQHIEDRPRITDNGLRATGGSVTSNQLYYDLRFRQELTFDNSYHGFLLDFQRSEDFDGSFDRQLVGLKYGFSDKTEFWLQGDVFSEKALSDIYLHGRHQFSLSDVQQTLHAALILPDYFFNEKKLGRGSFH